ncbi:hypothetical protein VTK73DRAFT_2757 [Phialemonium thermophilum]|uniref:Uncharacterized protein n=1 Tax=Phialemonium thermophilum TaxID=223376 RepID=A0ABR3Y2G6_9PEZI
MFNMMALMPSAASSCPDLTSLCSESVKAGRAADKKSYSMDCNLPEMLVQDLEMSESVFMLKHMTAGAPTSGLAAGEEQQADLPVDLTSTAQAAHYHRLLTTMQSLRALDEWSSKLDFAFNRGESFPGEDPASDSTSESSCEETEPPPIRLRHQSVETAPSSVTSGCAASPSQKSQIDTSPSMPRDRQGSWVDLDQDETEPDPSPSQEPPRRPHSRRPNSSQGFCSPRDTMQKGPFRSSEPAKEGFFMPFHLPVTYGPSGERPRTSSGNPSMDDKLPLCPLFPPPTRGSSLQHQHQHSASESSMGLVDSSKSSGRTAISSGAALNQENEWPSSPPSNLKAGVCDRGTIDGTAFLDDSQAVKPAPNTPAGHERATRSSLHEGDDAVWITGHRLPRSSTDPQAGRTLDQVPERPRSDLKLELSPLSKKHMGHTAPGVPLPPDVVETLRVSVVCFPETMLLSSSLSIETIRNYSKKVRHDTHRKSTDEQALLSLSSSQAVDSRRRWKLSALRAPRKAHAPQGNAWSRPALAQPSAGITANTEEELGDGDMANAPAPKWQSLKNIFPAGSDYLCDALYAHLVAYNYIGSLCGRDPTVRPLGRDTNREGADYDEGVRREQSGSAIPKKAASLLGLSGPGQDPSSGPAVRNFGRRPVNLFTGERSTGAATSATAREDPSVRELHAGLGKCIASLVSTLKLTGDSNESFHEAHDIMAVKPDLAGDLEPLLLRALCEVVRCSEEAL